MKSQIETRLVSGFFSFLLFRKYKYKKLTEYMSRPYFFSTKTINLDDIIVL